MNESTTLINEMPEYDNNGYLIYKGNRFLIDRGVLKDVLVECETVRVPEDVREIRRQAFIEAREEGKMETLVIPATVRKIERLSFSGMESLRRVEILAGIIALEPGTFRNCINLETVFLPTTLMRIESRVFENCERLSNVVLGTGNVRVVEDAFMGCGRLKNKQIEDAIARELSRQREEEEEVRGTKYPALKFTSEEKKEAPEIDASQEEKPEETPAFPPGVNENTEFCIQDGVLTHCEIGCKHIVIPEGVIEIGPEAFANAEKKELLERLDIPEGVERLERHAFYGLTNLTEIHIPATVSYIGAEALEGTSWLTKERRANSCVCVNGILISAFYDSMVMEAGLPEEVWRIAPYAFYQNEVRLVKLPESVQVVDAYAFTEADITELEFSSRPDVEFHNPVVVRCHKLKEIYIPGKIERIEENFAEDCLSLQRVCLKGMQTVVHKRAFPEDVRIWVI
ncbi:MAG: leucine-rich repeat domain-containing protein [Lachnospiraceae bacterium]|nr:leucine-rich repeat domain-containing protein [Lachnospiraceae bacterium]